MILKKIKNSFDLKVVSILVLLLLLFLFSNSVIITSNLIVKFISLIIFSICCIPIFLHYLDNNKETIPLFHLSILFYGVMFALPSLLSVEFLSKLYSTLYSKETIFYINNDLFYRNIFFILIFVLLYLFGYFFFNFFQSKKFLFEFIFLRKFKLKDLLFLSCIFFLIKFCSILFPILNSFSSINQLFIPLGYFSFASFYYYLIKEKPKLTIKLLIILCMLIIFFGSIISSNSLIYSLNCLIIIMIIYYIFKKKIPWLFLIFFLIIIIFSPLKNILRIKNLEVNLTENLTENFFKEVKSTPNHNGGLARAFNSYFIYHFVLLKVPEKYPYFEQSTYSNLITSIIPRALWKNKPKSEVGREFSVKYGFNEQGNLTSINLPWVAELYLNFSFLIS